MKKRSKQTSFPQESWELSGMICVGRRWDTKKAHSFKMSFKAYNREHARKVGMERLKAFAKREQVEAEEKKLLLDGVALVNGKCAFSLRPQYKNNSILYAVRPRLVFEELPIISTM